MDTQTLQVFSLRGMDERWIVDPQDALYIQDMTWTQNDSWRSSGGFFQLFTPKAFEKEEDTSQGQVAGSNDGENTSSSDSATTDAPRFGTINSIHWFAQHNGARQWLIYEEQNSKFNSTTGKLEPDGTVSLKVFDGTLGKRFTNDAVPADAEVKPFRTLVQYEDINFVSSSGPRLSELNIRSESQLATRTQSQSYGGRIYLVNGYDEPLVFDGDLCERAGFSQKPPAPITQTSGFENSTTFPFAVGNFSQNVIINDDLTSSDEETVLPFKDSTRDFKGKGPTLGFYSLHKNVPYWGIGVTSDASANL